MVRLMCQSQCPRVCCDEGEKVDQIRAERAVTALYKPEEKNMTFRTFFNENESSNDSITNAMTSESLESDSEGEHLFIAVNEEGLDNENNSNQGKNKQVDTGRKQKRRERNKRSAQAYRQRRRQQRGKVDETLHELLEKNHLLREKVNRLEEEKNITLDLLKKKIKISWPHPIWMPYPTGMWSSQDATMSTQIAMDTSVQEVTVAS